MAEIITNSDMVRTAVAATVYTRETLADSWTEREHLLCEWCEWCVSPKTSGAQLTWHYGEGRQPGDAAVATIARLEILDHWVKIVIPQTEPGTGDTGEEHLEDDAADDLVWYGRIKDVVRNSTSSPASQTFTCVGMEDVLNFTIRKSWTEGSGADENVVQWGLEFNRPDTAKASTDRPDSTGNRSENVGPRGYYTFAGPTSEQLEDAATWSTLTIVGYLLAYHHPLDGGGAISIVMAEHAADFALYMPDWDRPRVPTHGRTLKQVLDSLLDRKRGLGYVVEFDPDAVPVPELTIRPFVYNDTAITLPSGETWPANDNAHEFNYEGVLDLQNATLQTVAAQKYDQVRAIGQRPVFCLTLKATPTAADTTIVRHWDAALQTAYNDGASNEAAYIALTAAQRAEKQQMNRDARAAEELARVYAWFGPAAGWPEEDDGEDWENPIPEALYTVFGLVYANGDRFFYRPTMVLERQLPLEGDIDYSASGLTNNTPDNLHWEFSRPLVVFKLKDDLPSTEGKYQLADKLEACAAIEGTGDGGGRDFSCSIHVRTDCAGFVLRVHGEHQHAIAADDFGTGADDTDTSDGLPQYDWKDELLATVAVRPDCVLEKYHPDPVATTDPLTILTVDASARAAFHWLPNGVVVGVDANGDLITADGSIPYIRDDRDLLEDAARIAWEWYGVERQALTITLKSAQNADIFVPKLGHLITEIGDPDATPATDEEIRTAITSVRVTFAKNVKQTHTTTVQTQWAELDVMRLLQ